jgi:hypothetical protein
MKAKVPIGKPNKNWRVEPFVKTTKDTIQQSKK